MKQTIAIIALALTSIFMSYRWYVVNKKMELFLEIAKIHSRRLDKQFELSKILIQRDAILGNKIDQLDSAIEKK